jgi:hypothetical protein
MVNAAIATTVRLNAPVGREILLCLSSGHVR